MRAELPDEPQDRPWRDAGVVVAVWVLAVVLVDPRADVPLIDDWTYAASVEQILAGQGFAISPWSSTFPAAQIWWGVLFAAVGGFSFTTLRLSTLVLGCGGALALLGLLRALGVRPRAALLGALTFSLYPVGFVLSFTYMTDVPFVAVTIAGLWALVSGLRGAARDGDGAAPRWHAGEGDHYPRAAALAWITLGLGLAVVAYLIRPVAIAIPLGLLATAVVHRDLRGRAATALLALGALAAMGGAAGVAMRLWPYVGEGGFAWRIPRLAYVFLVSPVIYAEALLSQLAHLGLAALPVLVATAAARGRRPWRTATALLAAAAAVSLVAPETVSALKPKATWSVEELGAARPLLQGLAPRTAARAWVELAATGVGLVAAAGLLARLRRGLRAGGALRTPGFTCVLAFGAASLGLCFGLWFFYDRYYLPLVPVVLAIALAEVRVPGAAPGRRPAAPLAPPSHERPALRLFPATLALVALAALDVTGTRDMLDYATAVSGAVDRLAAAGVPYDQMDAGYVESGWRLYVHPEHLPAGATLDDVPHVTSAGREPFVLANTALAGYAVRETVTLTPWWAQGDRLYVLEDRGGR
jgi:4-amino-4-deoxy-L-arabinose transferase-like glycosyltransferase